MEGVLYKCVKCGGGPVVFRASSVGTSWYCKKCGKQYFTGSTGVPFTTVKLKKFKKETKNAFTRSSSIK